MKSIGKYQGIFCYVCDTNEYLECLRNGTDNGKQIFIIDGTMVKKNEIIGYYDGKHVKEDYSGKQFYTAPTYYPSNTNVMDFGKWAETPVAANKEAVDKLKVSTPAVSSTSGTNASYDELVKQDIDFGKYSTVVDEFFALLEA